MSQAVITSDGLSPNLLLTCSPRSWEKKPSPAPMSATRIPGFTSDTTSSSALSLVLRCEIGRISFSDTVSVILHVSGHHARELLQNVRKIGLHFQDRQYRVPVSY